MFCETPTSLKTVGQMVRNYTDESCMYEKWNTGYERCHNTSCQTTDSLAVSDIPMTGKWCQWREEQGHRCYTYLFVKQ